jgi:hypothetical protein
MLGRTTVKGASDPGEQGARGQCDGRRTAVSELQHDLNLLYGTLVGIIQDLGFT